MVARAVRVLESHIMYMGVYMRVLRRHFYCGLYRVHWNKDPSLNMTLIWD